MPIVSVIIPAYNAASFVERAVKSALGQTMVDIEVILVDDGSTDGTAEIAARIAEADDRLRLVSLEENRGVSAARNAALGHSKGEWVAVLDADDWYDPDRLSCMIEAAKAASVGIVMDNQTLLREGSGRQVGHTLFPEGGEGFVLSPLAYLKSIKPERAESYASLKPVFRRSIIEAHDLRYHEGMNLGEDANFLIRCLAYAGRCLVLRKPFYFRVLRPGSLRSGWSRAYVSARLNAYNELLDLYAGDRAITELLVQRRKKFNYFVRVMNIFAPLRRFEFGRALKASLRDPLAFPGFVIHVVRLSINKLRARLGLSAIC